MVYPAGVMLAACPDPVVFVPVNFAGAAAV